MGKFNRFPIENDEINKGCLDKFIMYLTAVLDKDDENNYRERIEHWLKLPHVARSILNCREGVLYIGTTYAKSINAGDCGTNSFYMGWFDNNMDLFNFLENNRGAGTLIKLRNIVTAEFANDRVNIYSDVDSTFIKYEDFAEELSSIYLDRDTVSALKLSGFKHFKKMRMLDAVLDKYEHAPFGLIIRHDPDDLENIKTLDLTTELYNGHKKKVEIMSQIHPSELLTVIKQINDNLIEYMRMYRHVVFLPHLTKRSRVLVRVLIVDQYMNASVYRMDFDTCTPVRIEPEKEGDTNE